MIKNTNSSWSIISIKYNMILIQMKMLMLSLTEMMDRII